jgi:uracil-DNA glycosylase
MTSVAELAAQAASCTRCDLYRNASTTVFGEGAADARLLLVGEQPGDVEDKQGRPFVGPAGRVLDKAMRECGIARSDTYLTNAVKHFRFTQSGKRRLHQPPNRTQIVACRFWLEAELRVVSPAVLVSLGAVAGSSLLGPGFRVSDHRGKAEEVTVGGWSGLLIATIHPSAVLRSADAPARDAAYAGLVADLQAASTAARRSA